MANVVVLPGNEGPVNEGERRVLATLRHALSDQYTIYPNVEFIREGGIDECDLIVVGPRCVHVIEVKDLRFDVVVQDQRFIVNGEERLHPLKSTNAKARRIQGRLAGNAPDLKGVRVEALVVLARTPRRFDCHPLVADRVVELRNAVRAIESQHLPPHAIQHLDEIARGRVAAALKLSLRPIRGPLVFNNTYRTIEALFATPEEEGWIAEHVITGHQVRLHRVHLGRLASEDERNARIEQARRQIEVARALGHHSNIGGPREMFFLDDGSMVLVTEQRAASTLADLAGEGVAVTTEARMVIAQDVISALAALHETGIAHRRLCPSAIEVDSSGRARLTDFGFARLGASGPVTAIATAWRGDVDPGFVAPELLAVQPPADARPSDLYGLGRLVSFLWPDDDGAGLAPIGPAPPLLLEVASALQAPRPEDRRPDARSLDRKLRGDGQAGVTIDVREIVVGEEFGRYVIEGCLGGGATSTVYRVFDPLAAQNYAMKVYDTEHAVDTMQREFRALLGIQHRYVVGVRDAGQVAGRSYLVMELLEGPTLAEVIASGPVAVEDARSIASKLLDALDHIHPDVDQIEHLTVGDIDDLGLEELNRLRSSGIVHRDLKPENVILASRGPVIFDFGISSTGALGAASGTAAYRPPDASADAADPDVDLFAIGVIAAEMIAGRRRGTPGEDDVLATAAGTPLGAFISTAAAPARVNRFRSARRAKAALAPMDDGSEPAPPNRMKDALADSGVSAPPPSLIGPYELHHVADHEITVARTLHGVRGVPGTSQRYAVQVSGAVVSEVRSVEASNGERWVECVAIAQDQPELAPLLEGYHLGVLDKGATFRVELRLAQPSGDRCTLRDAQLPELESRAGADVEAILRGAGATRIARLSVLEPAAPRPNRLAAEFPCGPLLVAVNAYVLTRVLPLLVAVGVGTDR